jgi:arylsulfatase A-like enzyme
LQEVSRATTRVAIPGFVDVILVALGFGAAAGVAEFVLRVIAERVISTPILLNPDSIWLGPISGVAILLPIVLVAWAIGRLRSASYAWMMAVAVAAFFSALDVSLLAPRLHPAAVAVIAAGVASQVIALARLRPAIFRWLLQRGTAALVTVALLGGLWTRGWRAVSERRAMSARAQASPDAPNVILLVLDTVRALELSAYGYGRPTSPRLSALARDGVRFDRAVATAPWTLPTHASLFTGLYQRDLSVGWTTPLNGASETLAERLARSGYATGGFIANLRYCSREYGLARGFQVYRDYAPIASQLAGSTMLGRRFVGSYNDLAGSYILPGRKDGRRVVEEFLDWRSDIGKGPYFAFLNFFDAHEPYAPRAPYDHIFSPEEPRTRGIDETTSRPPSPEVVRGLQDAYDGSIASLDAELGHLFDELARRGELDRTIVIVTADHGEEFAEHGLLSHGNGLNFPALHVPLIVRWPSGGVPAGTVVGTPVSLRDVPATILDLARTINEVPFPGRSLAPLWSGTPDAPRSPLLSELYWAPNQPSRFPVSSGNLHSLVRGRFHLIVGKGGREELYDIVSDPFERRSLIGDATLSDTLASLRDGLVGFTMRDRKGR